MVRENNGHPLLLRRFLFLLGLECRLSRSLGLASHAQWHGSRAQVPAHGLTEVTRPDLKEKKRRRTSHGLTSGAAASSG